MHKGFLRTASVLGMLAVAMGAFAAHSLKNKVSDHAIATFETGTRYMFYHVFALLITGMLYKDLRSAGIIWAGRFFILGIILFSGSLYGLTVLQATVQPGYKWIGAITPLGGISFIVGWLMLFITVYRSKNT
jgi:uncharacterized membrane protein YgdD (TMEM256/DUF423 family)